MAQDRKEEQKPEGMVPWEQTQEAMDLGDSHPEDDIWIGDEDWDGGNSQADDGNSQAGDSRIMEGQQQGSVAAGGEYQEGQEPEVAQGGPQEAQGSPQEAQGSPQEAQGSPQEAQGGEEGEAQEGEMLSVDDPTHAQQLLQNVDKMDRPHLIQVAKLIWGDDYEPEEWATDDYLREDVRGSLMDIIEGQGGTVGSEEEEE